MITGIIALFILIVGVWPAASNGDTGTAVLGAVIAVLVLLFGIFSREENRAFNNFVHYWSTGEEPGKRDRQDSVRRREERTRMRNDRKAEKALKRYREEHVTDEPVQRTVKCRNCGKDAREVTRTRYPSGAEYVQYSCPYCGEKKLVKM